MPADPVSELTAATAAVAGALPGAALSSAPTLERPKQEAHGDYSTNAAMLLAPSLGRPPREIAEQLAQALADRLGDAVERTEVAGPGFLNIFLSDRWMVGAVAGAVAAGRAYGEAPRDGRRVDIEFVSANPTGPITVAAARHAAYGDSLARLLEMAGSEVEREYYVNDRGSQIRRFGASLRARAAGEEPPEGGYLGAYVADLAEQLGPVDDLDDDALGARGVELMVASIRATLDRFGVHMDRFVSEGANHDAGSVERALGHLRERGEVFEDDGAVWLRTSARGDDKDRVLVRSTGEKTYFAADIAYHEDKRSRGYDRVIDVLGADHHGYVERMRAAWAALGAEPEAFEIQIMQLVNLLEGGRRAQMSKRQGEFVTLDDLIDDIGVDATRWFLVQRSHETTLDLDLDLARTESQDNPVYYVQYAHARIASILRRAGEERVASALAADHAASAEVLHPSARALVKRLLEFPGAIAEAAERRAPHRMTTYVTDAAQAFSAFYRDCQVVGASETGGDEDLRIALCVVCRDVIARGLDLLGVEAPDEM